MSEPGRIVGCITTVTRYGMRALEKEIQRKG